MLVAFESGTYKSPPQFENVIFTWSILDAFPFFTVKLKTLLVAFEPIELGVTVTLTSWENGVAKTMFIEINKVSKTPKDAVNSL